jgi:DNA-directed RNA polymerase specialized sigma24 family protein
MFPFPPKPERCTSFEDIFFEHYSRLLEWALQLTRRDRSDAEDLVQELYVRFARLDTTPEHVENAESYLFSALRNLHHTRAKRARTSVVDDLSIVDYDSVHHGVRAVDRSELLSVRSDLYRICDYLCSRKDTSRSASMFILRYFLGYFPNEVMKVVQSSRVSVDKAIQAVRREAGLDLRGLARFARSVKSGSKRHALPTDLKASSISSSRLGQRFLRRVRTTVSDVLFSNRSMRNSAKASRRRSWRISSAARPVSIRPIESSACPFLKIAPRMKPLAGIHRRGRLALQAPCRRSFRTVPPVRRTNWRDAGRD